MVGACTAGTVREQTPIKPVAVVAPPIVPITADYNVLPGQLGDPDVMARIPHRAYVRWGTRGVLRVGQEARGSDDDEADGYKATPVIGEGSSHVRVVSEYDDARVAVWIPRTRVAPVAIARAPLMDASGTTTGETGVWIEPGAQLEIRSRSATRPEIAIVNERLRATGYVVRAAIGVVFVKRDEPAFAPTATIVADTWIRTAPNTDAVAIARAIGALGVIAGPPHDGWRRIELRRDHVHVVGYVPVAAVLEELAEEWGTIGTGSYGTRSHYTPVPTPVGACLYDSEDGEVVGVNTKQRTRVGQRMAGAWQSVYVNTRWSGWDVFLHVVSIDDKNVPTYESCLPP